MIGLTGITALEAEMRDRLKAKDFEIQRLRAALKECADDLEALVSAEYHDRAKYPTIMRRYMRDIEPVRKARVLLGNSP